MSPEFLVWLSGRLDRQPGVKDCVLMHTGPRPAPQLELVVRHALEDHPRVFRARRVRDDVQVFSDRAGPGLVTVGRGLGGRLDLRLRSRKVRRMPALVARCWARRWHAVPLTSRPLPKSRRGTLGRSAPSWPAPSTRLAPKCCSGHEQHHGVWHPRRTNGSPTRGPPSVSRVGPVLCAGGTNLMSKLTGSANWL
jgi:hypothetical protein